MGKHAARTKGSFAKRLIVAVLFGVLGLYMTVREFGVPILGSAVIVNPKEAVMMVGSAFTGALGGAIVGIMSTVLEHGQSFHSAPSFISFSLVSHAIGLFLLGLVFGGFVRRVRSRLAQALFWLLASGFYYFLVMTPIEALLKAVFYEKNYSSFISWTALMWTSENNLFEAAFSIGAGFVVVLIAPKGIKRSLLG